MVEPQLSRLRFGLPAFNNASASRAPQTHAHGWSMAEGTECTPESREFERHALPFSPFGNKNL